MSVYALALIVLTLSGCAGSGQKPRDDSGLPPPTAAEFRQTNQGFRRDLTDLRAQVHGVGLMTASREDLAGLRTELEAVQGAIQMALRDSEQRQHEAFEALDRRLSAAERRVEEIAASVRGMEASLGGLSEALARLEAVPRAEATGPAEEKGVAGDKVEKTERVDGTARPEKPEATAAHASSGSAPETLFGKAIEDFRRGAHTRALWGFSEVVRSHPTHALAVTAQFWVGETYFNARDYEHATVEYQKAVKMAPRGEKTPDALFKLGLAHRALGRPERAREVWAALVRDFPRSQAAQRARTALREVSSATKPGVSANRP